MFSVWWCVSWKICGIIPDKGCLLFFAGWEIIPQYLKKYLNYNAPLPAQHHKNVFNWNLYSSVRTFSEYIYNFRMWNIAMEILSETQIPPSTGEDQ